MGMQISSRLLLLGRGGTQPLYRRHATPMALATATAAAAAAARRRHDPHRQLSTSPPAGAARMASGAPLLLPSPWTRARALATTTTTTPEKKATELYTASFAFFEALWELGVTYCFVNLGSDHPSILEAMVRGQREKKGEFPRIITCPNEMVAMSMADGYARLTGRPQAVIIHVDVGTQGLGAAVHNSSTGRAPVLLFAGLSPVTQDGELRGSRTEYIHWIQDVHDQRAILAQYCRYAAEIKSGVNIKQMTARAMQMATSAPRGPVYLCASREVLETDVEPYQLRADGVWTPSRLGGLPDDAASRLAADLASARRPLVITGYAGRNQAAPGLLVRLADAIPGLRVLDTTGSDMCFPADHPAWRGLRYGVDDTIREADLILILDCDVPWIPAACSPRPDARVWHIDVDPLKDRMPVFWMDAHDRFRADGATVLGQVLAQVERMGRADGGGGGSGGGLGAEGRRQEHTALLAAIAERAKPQSDGSFGTTHLCTRLREICPADTIFAVEAVTNIVMANEGLQPTLPGTWLNCGGGGLGWSGGGAMGIKLAVDDEAARAGNGQKPRLVVQVVGDGTFLFSVPGSVYWIARRYQIPILTIVINNKGWNAPRRSLLLVHPDGEAAAATNDELHISIDNPTPDYGGIARAAAGGDLFTSRVDQADQLDEVLRRAVREVMEEGRCAVVDCKVVNGC